MTGVRKRATSPPKHLTSGSAKLWRSVLSDYELEARHEATLLVGLEARDRMLQAQAAIEADGAYIDGRFGKKAHPALAVERDSRVAFMRAMRELGLDLEAPPSARPPTRWR